MFSVLLLHLDLICPGYMGLFNRSSTLWCPPQLCSQVRNRGALPLLSLPYEVRKAAKMYAWAKGRALPPQLHNMCGTGWGRQNKERQRLVLLYWPNKEHQRIIPLDPLSAQVKLCLRKPPLNPSKLCGWAQPFSHPPPRHTRFSQLPAAF